MSDRYSIMPTTKRSLGIRLDDPTLFIRLVRTWTPGRRCPEREIRRASADTMILNAIAPNRFLLSHSESVKSDYRLPACSHQEKAVDDYLERFWAKSQSARSFSAYALSQLLWGTPGYSVYFTRVLPAVFSAATTSRENCTVSGRS